MASTIRPAFTSRFYSEAPSFVDDSGSRHWVTRGANFVVVASQVMAAAPLRRLAADQSDEYFVLLAEHQAASVVAGSESMQSDGDSLFIVPPGDSTVTVAAAGWVYRIFSKLAADLLAHARNAAEYEGKPSDVADLLSWPAPVGGERLRHYALAAHVQAAHPMRLFRSRNLMVNVFPAGKGPRDVRKMSPHSHDDFEQASLALSGGWVHHMRYPWTPDMTSWRADEHEAINSPSIIIIPPKVIHTSQSLGDSGMRLVDVFAPPRADFSLTPGLVCNADEYPLPAHLVAHPAAQPAQGTA